MDELQHARCSSGSGKTLDNCSRCVPHPKTFRPWQFTDTLNRIVLAHSEELDPRVKVVTLDHFFHERPIRTMADDPANKVNTAPLQVMACFD